MPNMPCLRRDSSLNILGVGELDLRQLDNTVTQVLLLSDNLPIPLLCGRNERQKRAADKNEGESSHRQRRDLLEQTPNLWTRHAAGIVARPAVQIQKQPPRKRP